MGWMAVRGALRKGIEKWADPVVAGVPRHYRRVLSDANTDANRYRNVCVPADKRRAVKKKRKMMAAQLWRRV